MGPCSVRAAALGSLLCKLAAAEEIAVCSYMFAHDGLAAVQPVPAALHTTAQSNTQQSCMHEMVQIYVSTHGSAIRRPCALLLYTGRSSLAAAHIYYAPGHDSLMLFVGEDALLLFTPS